MERSFVIRCLLVIAVCSMTHAANAGIFLCNETAENVYVAIGYEENGHWLSRGWYRFTPRECDSLYLGLLENPHFYYYANSESGKTVWGGDGTSDPGYFCTSDDAFFFNSDSFDCAGKNFRQILLDGVDQYSFQLIEGNNPRTAALHCRSQIQNGTDAFAKCWMRNMATEKQLDILNCWDRMNDLASFAICANKDNMSQRQYEIASCAGQYNQDKMTSKFVKCISADEFNDSDRRLINCAIENGTNYSATLDCAAINYLTPEQQRLYGCVANNINSYVSAGVCIAGDRLTPEERRIAGCVLNYSGRYMQMGLCAAGSPLTPEQQVFVSCAMSTGGQPYAFAGCVGTQLTMNELQKCMTIGIGGNGCFGENNTAVKFVSNAFKDITQGPGPSNDLLGRDGWVGRTAQNVGNDLTHGPNEHNDLVGREGFVCKTFFGGC